MLKKIAISILVCAYLQSQDLGEKTANKFTPLAGGDRPFDGKSNDNVSLVKDKDVSVSISNIYFKYSNYFLENNDIDSALKYCTLAYQFDKDSSDIKYLFAKIYYEKGQYLKSYYTLYYTLKNPNFSYFKYEPVISLYVRVLDRLKKFPDIKDIILTKLNDFEIKNNSDILYYLLKSAKATNDKNTLNKYKVYTEYIANKIDIYSFLMPKQEYINYLNTHIPMFSQVSLDKFYPKEYINSLYLDSIITYLKLQDDYEKNKALEDKKAKVLDSQSPSVSKDYSKNIKLISTSKGPQDTKVEDKESEFSIIDSDIFDSYIKRGGNNPFIVYSMLKYDLSHAKDKSNVDYKKYVENFIKFKGFEDMNVLLDFYNMLDDVSKDDILKYFKTNEIFINKDNDSDGYIDESYYYSNGKIVNWYIDKNQDGIYDLVLHYNQDGLPDSFDQINTKYSFGNKSPIEVQYDKKIYYFSKFPYVSKVDFIGTNNEDTKIYLSGNSFYADIVKLTDTPKNSNNLSDFILNNKLETSAIPNIYFDTTFIDNSISKDLERDTDSFNDFIILKSQFNNKGFPYKQWVYSMGKKYAYRQDTNNNGIYDYIVSYDSNGFRNYGFRDIDEDGLYDILEEFKDDKVIKTSFLDKDNIQMQNANNLILSDKRKFEDIFLRINNDIKN